VAVHPSSVCLLLVSLLLLSSCDCAEEERTSAQSPDGELRAVVTVVNCGATSGFVTAVTIERLRGPGSSETVLQVRHRPPLEVRWEGKRSLVIEHHPCRPRAVPLQMILHQSHWQDVVITRVEGTPVDCSEPKVENQKASR
jgi:hypothetical protein